MADNTTTLGSDAPPNTAASPSSITIDHWREAIPKEFKDEAVLAQDRAADFPTLIKNYVNAQKKIGVLSSASIPRPAKDWKPEQWEEFYQVLGRPGTAGDYKLPEVKFEDGLQVDEPLLEETRKIFHAAGLTQDQASKVLEFYFNTLNNQVKTEKASRAQARQAALDTLRQEWGDKFDAQLDMAQKARRHFCGDDFVEYLDQTGLGDHPSLIKAFASIGAKVMEDQASGRGAAMLGVKSSTAALDEIRRLTLDKNFMSNLDDASAPGHTEALRQWLELYQRAYPTPAPSAEK